MKGCELCDQPARMYCESDQASLCWDCDARVHGANFLVARHSRSLLCRRCQDPTPWKAEGACLGHTVSICERCACRSSDGGKTMERGEDVAEEDDGEGDDEAEDEEDDGEEEDDEGDEGEEMDDEEEEDGDNQVVPWKLTPPPPSSSSSSDESSSRKCSGFLKRVREDSDPGCSEDNATRTSCHADYLAAAPTLAPVPSSSFTAWASVEDEATSFGSPFRHSKERRRSDDHAQLTIGQSALFTSLHIRNRQDQWTVNTLSSASSSPPI